MKHFFVGIFCQRFYFKAFYVNFEKPSTNVSGLAAGETKKYRFIAPASKDNSNKVRYMFYSQMYNSSEGIELTANISLASEVSAYTLDTIQKDDNGNFYYIVELTPGRQIGRAHV